MVIVCQGETEVAIIKFLARACQAAKWAAIPAAALALAACEPVGPRSAGGSGPRTGSGETVKVALLVPRGTGQAGDEVLATALENAARLAIADLNGANIDMTVYGTAGSAAGATTAASTAINDGADIILGPVYADAANAAGVVAAQRGVNVLAFSNNRTIAGNNVFVLGPLFETSAMRLMNYAKSQGKQSVAGIYADNLAGQLAQHAVNGAASRAGVTVTGSVVHPFSQQGIIDAMPQIKSAALAADSVFLTSTTDGALPLLTQLMPENGINPEEHQYISLTRLDIPPQTLELPGVQNAWFALPDPGRTAQFNARYKGAYGTSAHSIAGLAYDGIAAIGALMASGRQNALSRQSLTQSQGFEGVTGIFRLNSDGTNDRGLAVATIRDKQVVVIDGAPRSFSGVGF